MQAKVNIKDEFKTFANSLLATLSSICLCRGEFLRLCQSQNVPYFTCFMTTIVKVAASLVGHFIFLKKK